MNNLTKEEIDLLANYLLIFKKAYYLATREALNTVEQLINLINGGNFTFEDDVWGIYLDTALHDLMDNELEYFDNHIEEFMCEIYFPTNTSLPEGGAWIKIRTETGFEVHYAKKAIRKKRWNELIEKCLKSANRTLRVRDTDKAKPLLDKLPELRIRQALNLPPYEVYIYRTKTKKEYYYTNQYTIIENIEEFSNAYISSVTGLYAKTLYSSVNKDAIFYLQSRGIPKKVAEIMASLKQMYFVVNMEEAITEYNRQWEESLKSIGFTNEPTFAQNVARAGYEINH
jgi:hypothetical protein